MQCPRQPKLISALCAVLFLLGGCSGSDDPVSVVKESVLEENLSISIGRVLDGYADCMPESRAWNTVKGEKGTSVIFSCRLESATYGWSDGRIAASLILNQDNEKDVVTLLSSAGGLRVADRAVLDDYNKALDELMARPRDEKFQKANLLVQEARGHLAQIRANPTEGLYVRNAFLGTLINRIETLFAVSEGLEADLVVEFGTGGLSKEKADLQHVFLKAVWPERSKTFDMDRDFMLQRIYRGEPLVDNGSMYPLAEMLQPGEGSNRVLFVDRED